MLKNVTYAGTRYFNKSRVVGCYLNRFKPTYIAETTSGGQTVWTNGPFRAKVTQFAPLISKTDIAYDNPNTNPDTNAHKKKCAGGRVISIGLNEIFARSKHPRPTAKGTIPNTALKISVAATPSSKNVQPSASRLQLSNLLLQLRYLHL